MTALYGTVFLTAFLSNHISTVFRSMTCRTTWIARDRPLPIAALPPAASKERSLRTVPCVIQTFQIAGWISACFAYAGLSHVRFFDCTIHKGGFAFSQLKGVTLLDCSMESVNMGNCALDGCSFARIRARDIRRLATSTIMQGGVTQEECERLREQTYRALGVELPERSCAKRSIGRERGSR